jgi:NADPH-dependent 2,4-dienoyl-CoA reductase/sulfur reductase-like enzyme/nitrite reductase/ring-hydroxylating ferredoxin subunit
MSDSTAPGGPDLRAGIAFADVPEGGCLAGRAGDDGVLLVRRGDEIFAIAATCSHYGGPLADGALIGHGIHCPWHHACFDVRTGEAVGPPAPRPIDTWEVVREGARVRVGAKRSPTPAQSTSSGPSSVVIVGAGAAGDAAAAMLRRLGYAGPVTMISRDDEGAPVDRPNLSKNYLDGSAPEEWIPLRGADWYAEHGITLRPGTEVVKLDPARHEIALAGGRTMGYGALVLATGAVPVRLDIPGATLPHVHVLRTLGDARAIIAAAATARRAVVLGSSFIGLEVAASLRTRGLSVDVVSPDAVPLGRVLGPELGAFVRSLHEDKGVRFRLGRKPAAIGARDVTLDDGTRVPCDLVVMGVGVRPATALAEAAGLTVRNGVVVDAQLRTSAPDVYAAGDVARYPSGNADVRIEHWVVAQKAGQLVARNLIGEGAAARWVPFFWSQHYDLPINYVGHAEGWDAIEVAGDIAARDGLVAYRKNGRIVAMASIYRDRDSLLAEDAMARDDQAALEGLMRSQAGPKE